MTSRGSSGMPVAIVTGASSGFGLGTCVELARGGCFVVATMRDLSKRGPLLEQARQAGVEGRLVCECLDVTIEARTEELVRQIVATYGRIDVLVNNAGIAVAGFTEEIGLQGWKRQFDTNVFGVIAMTKAVLPYMREAGRGRIIQIGSISGRFGFPAMGPYTASKFALEGFSESLRLELLPFGVHVSIVEPGPYQTNIWSRGDFHADPHSAYARLASGVQSMMKQSAASGGDPSEVAELIARIALSRRPPKLRYPIGRGVRRNIALKQLLPWSWIELVVKRVLGHP
ncbi:SDR family oxidoreductase [Paenibacillus chartarius]|uniref:SDR family oxidoreductase n=1 Tax=Paenibacillus chartarius TaxID=747481 RepID=A0ABV6DEW1_9BACL